MNIKSIKVVVPVSGGKDSQVCLKRAVSEFGNGAVLGLFCDTGFEHPKTYKHVEYMSGLYGVEIKTISGGTVEEMIRRFKRFPEARVRFCTSHLKMRPSKAFYKELAEKQGGFQVWYGMRSGESSQRKARYEGVLSDELYDPNDIISSEYPKYLGKMGVKFRLPIIDWRDEQVFDYLAGDENPLYREGFGRVGCFPCLASSAANQANAFNFDGFGASQKQKVITLERDIGVKCSGANTEQMCMFCAI